MSSEAACVLVQSVSDQADLGSFGMIDEHV